jgi:hypothetical protein
VTYILEKYLLRFRSKLESLSLLLQFGCRSNRVIWQGLILASPIRCGAAFAGLSSRPTETDGSPR